MKVAYHFLADHPDLGSPYHLPIIRRLVSTILTHLPLRLSTKVFVGDLLLHRLATDQRQEGTNVVETINQSKFHEKINQWLHPDSSVLVRFIDEMSAIAVSHSIFVVCLESIDEDAAFLLHKRLSSLEVEWYCGMMEVDDAAQIHWYLYSEFLRPLFRISGNKATVFWDGVDEENKKDRSIVDVLEASGLRPCTFEALNGRYTIFDAYHNPDHARRVTIWKRRTGNLLAFVADNAISRLSDPAPDLGDKLFAALKTFEGAETNEEYAQVMVSCRRIFDYVADFLLPPSQEREGHSKYKNRLRAFADAEKASKTNTALVSVSVEVWAQQLDKLGDLANKGVHEEVFREEARRCLLRTILLLDDVISLREHPFEVKSHVDSETVRHLIDSLKSDLS